MTKAPPPEVQRFLAHIRHGPGRAAFEAWLRHRREEAVRAAIYGSPEDARTLHAGAARAWTEISDLMLGSGTK